MSTPNDLNKHIIEEFRTNQGRGGRHFENMTILLLDTISAISGEPRVNLVATIGDGDRNVVVASDAGADTRLDWYFKVVADPEVEVGLGMEDFQTLAELAPEPGQTEFYGEMAALQEFADYERKTERAIPIIALLSPS